MRADDATWTGPNRVIAGLCRALGQSLYLLVPLSIFCGALTYNLLSMMAPRYQAEAKLSIWPKGQGTPSPPAVRPDPASIYVDRQTVLDHVAAMRDPQLALAVGRDLNLLSRAEFNSARGDVDAWTRMLRRWGLRGATRGETDEERFLRTFDGAVQVYSPPDGQAIHVQVTSMVPELAAMIANRLAEIYRGRLAKIRSGQIVPAGPAPVDIEFIRTARAQLNSVFPKIAPTSIGATLVVLLAGFVLVSARHGCAFGKDAHTRRVTARWPRWRRSALLTAMKLWRTGQRFVQPRLQRLAVPTPRSHYCDLRDATRRRVALRAVKRRSTRYRDLLSARVKSKPPVSQKHAQSPACEPAATADMPAEAPKAADLARRAAPSLKALFPARAAFATAIAAWRRQAADAVVTAKGAAPLVATTLASGSGRVVDAASASVLSLRRLGGKLVPIRSQVVVLETDDLDDDEVADEPGEGSVSPAADAGAAQKRQRRCSGERATARSLLTLAKHIDRRLSHKDDGSLRVLVTSAAATPVVDEALAIAHAFADRGRRTLLIETSAGVNGCAASQNLPDAPGLAEVLSGTLSHEQATRPIAERKVQLLPAGKRRIGKALAAKLGTTLETMTTRYQVFVFTGAGKAIERLYQASSEQFDIVVMIGGQARRSDASLRIFGREAGEIDVFNLEVHDHSPIPLDRLRRALDTSRTTL